MEKRRRPRVTRSSVSLNSEDYARVCAIAEKHRPPLSARYVIEFAVTQFLDQVPKGQVPNMTAGIQTRPVPGKRR